MTSARLAWLGLIMLTGCARGCGPEPVPATTRAQQHTAPRRTAAPLPRSVSLTNLADQTETALAMLLPRRTVDQPFPGFATLPRRRLRRFVPSRHLIAQLRGATVTVLDRTAPADDTEAIGIALRAAMASWGQRSGVAANRLVLVVDRNAAPRDTARLRSAAISAHTWRVVVLAREADRLMEVHLSPPSRR